jgi:N-methylhydantoinase B
VIVRSTNGVIDSAGPGKFRSGYANSIVLECAKGDVLVSTILDSGRFERPGAESGGSGMTSFLCRVRQDDGHRIPQANGLIPVDHLVALAGRFDAEGRPDSQSGEWGLGAEFNTTKLTNLVLGEGEVLYVLAPCGGGFGDPLERAPELVRADVWNERLSVAAAAEFYGVVIGEGDLAVNAQATQDARAQIRARRGADGAGRPPVSGHRPWPLTVAELPPTAADRDATTGAVQ